MSASRLSIAATGPAFVTVEQAGAVESVSRPGLRQLVPYLREHRATLVLVALISLGGASAALAQPLLVRALLTSVEAGGQLLGPVLLLTTVLLLGALTGAVQQYLLQRTAEGVVLTARRTLAGHLLRLPVAEYDRRRTGDLISRIGADTTLLRVVVTSGLFEVVSSGLVVVGAVVAMLLIDPLLLLVTLVSVLTGTLVVVAAGRRMRALAVLSQVRVGEMTSAVERALSSVRTIRASGATEREVGAVSDSARLAYDAGVRAARLEALVSPAASIAVQGSFIAVLGLGGYRVATGTISVADLVAFILYLFLLVLPLAQLLQAYTQLQTGLGALDRIEEVVALRGEDDGDEATGHVAPGRPPTTTHPRDGTAPQGIAPMLELDHVDFTYGDGTPVLHDVSFAVPRGTRTALVGPSGAGKSTVLALVERFYDTDGGSIRLGGTDIRHLARADLRARLGYVEQEAPVLAGSLRDNLLMAAPGATQAQQDAVLAAVNLGPLAHRAQTGLDAPVGDDGVLLSGGERQRLAIARSLLSRPELLLLDEPTSSLDARNEAALRDAIGAVADTTTLLVVAHRLSTVADADQIVVLDGGRVVAVGRHDELVAAGGLYNELARHQLLA